MVRRKAKEATEKEATEKEATEKEATEGASGVTTAREGCDDAPARQPRRAVREGEGAGVGVVTVGVTNKKSSRMYSTRTAPPPRWVRHVLRVATSGTIPPRAETAGRFGAFLVT